MSYFMTHLHSGWHVDQDHAHVRVPSGAACRSPYSSYQPSEPWTASDLESILVEEDRVVCIRFGHDYDPECMAMDETLYGVTEKVQNFAIIYLVDITEVPDFNKMYELYDPCTLMFFYRNKHIMIDLGTGNNNKMCVATSLALASTPASALAPPLASSRAPTTALASSRRAIRAGAPDKQEVSSNLVLP
ncbi:U4/U6-U5 snRNP complex subunit dib1 [Saitozyma podzolica]|uniref:U4/U6-U5 snRNP complex subunit dib1 n=1 Tax=Saitozyma podzolica TaxID=1890683 RepID=A0A427YJZ8_9TREE|nr:U4/U6-U5 snRNP complex subunit dib1 [Saitozyma podzolica]